MDLLLQYALQFVGKPYRWGGNGVLGIDCSGLVQEILAAGGEDPEGDQTAQGLFDYFNANGRAEWNAYKLGALAFYGESVTKITHVAFCVDQYRCIEAGGGGSKTTTPEIAESQGAMVRMRLITRRRDLAAVLRPRYRAVGSI